MASQVWARPQDAAELFHAGRTSALLVGWNWRGIRLHCSLEKSFVLRKGIHILGIEFPGRTKVREGILKLAGSLQSLAQAEMCGGVIGLHAKGFTEFTDCGAPISLALQ